MKIKSLTTKELYDQFLNYFRIEELVSPDAFHKYKHHGDYFFLSRFDKRLIENMLWIRETLGVSITINTWYWGGRFSQRGLRDSSTNMMKKRAAKNDAWLSAHALAMGMDYDVEGQTAEEHREWLKERDILLPHPIRLERKFKGKQISWVHLDVCDDPKNPRVYEFDV